MIEIPHEGREPNWFDNWADPSLHFILLKSSMIKIAHSVSLKSKMKLFAKTCGSAYLNCSHTLMFDFEHLISLDSSQLTNKIGTYFGTRIVPCQDPTLKVHLGGLFAVVANRFVLVQVKTCYCPITPK